MKMANIEAYTPEEFFYGRGVLYFKDDEGRDWVRSAHEFKKKYKLAIDNTSGIIRSIDTDVTMLYPGGMTVVDVDELPDGCDIRGEWVFDGEKVIPRIHTKEEDILQAERTKSNLLSDASVIIQPIQDAVDLGIATEDEANRLIKLKTYRVMLSRTDISTAPDINWPDKPY